MFCFAQHDITGKATRAANAAVVKGKELDNKYSIMDRAKAAAKVAGQAAHTAYKKAEAYDEKHNVSGRVGSALSGALDRVSTGLAPEQQYRVGADTPAASTLPAAPGK